MLKTSALYSVISESEILKAGWGPVAVETGSSRTSVSVLTGEGDEYFGEQSGPGEKLSFGSEVKVGVSFLGDPAGAASGPELQNPWL